MRRALLVAAVVVGALWVAPGAFAKSAAWCGSGEATTDRTDIVTGRQIHAIVAIPAGSPDTFVPSADQMQADVDAVDGWWVGQDPTRRPRFDLGTFGAASCLDVSFLRLPETAFTSADAAFQAIGSDVSSAGFLNPYKKNLVYYGGPSVETDVCGVGGGDFDGPGIAIVIPAGCPSVPTDTVLAHELLHALGAVAPGDPHACPNDAGHPCDSPTDVLYPFTHGEPLAQKVLDFNRDDYYGHSGGWPDIQDSGWLSHLDTPQVAFAVTLVGAGTVTSDVPGIICAVSCTTQWDQGSTFSVTPAAAAGNRFVGWQGACKGVGSCFVTVDAAKSATAVFGPATIPVKVSVKGKGRVACTPACSKTFHAGAALTLKPVAAKGWRFVRWSGACTGTRRVCRPKTDFALAVRATFARRK